MYLHDILSLVLPLACKAPGPLQRNFADPCSRTPSLSGSPPNHTAGVRGNQPALLRPGELPSRPQTHGKQQMCAALRCQSRSALSHSKSSLVHNTLWQLHGLAWHLSLHTHTMPRNLRFHSILQMHLGLLDSSPPSA